ncbi:MAG: LysR family transcriptional regulator [Stackebrandtia sp.]
MDSHLRDLRYFVAVAEELSFTRAAERLYISQPALSKQIRQLEKTLRVRLLDRAGAVELTPGGRVLLERTRELLAFWDETQKAVAEAAAEVSGTLTVGLSTSAGRGLMRSARAAFSKRCADTWRIRVRQVNWEDATAGLADGDVDVALAWLPLPAENGVSTKVLATESRWVALREDHRLAGRDEIAFADLLDEPFLALPESAGALRDFWLAVAERDGRPARVSATVYNSDETFSAIEEGSGIVLLAAGNAEIYRRPGVVARPVVDLSPSSLAVAWRSDDRRECVHSLVDALVVAAA